MSKKIYVTPRSVTLNVPPDLKRLEKAGFEIIFAPKGEQPSQEQQLAILPQCVAYLAGAEVISRKILEKAPYLKVISRNGVGIENIDVAAAEEFGIMVKTTPGANAQSVAELAIALMFAATRSIPLLDKRMKSGMWKRENAYELRDKTLGLIGCGNIGKQVATMALGLRMSVLAYDLYPDIQFSPHGQFHFSNLDDIIKDSDIISLHCPPTETPIINKKTIDRMKPGVIIINTARAGVVDEFSILEALNSEKLRYYATDVYAKEPPEITALIQHDRCICTPHIGGYTEESINRAVEEAIDNILEILSNNKNA